MVLRASDQLYRSAREMFWWPLQLTGPDGEPVDILAAELVLVAGVSSLPPANNVPGYQMEIDNVLGLAGALLAGPDAAVEGAAVLALGRNKPWIRVDQDGEIFLRPARAVYCT